MKTARAASSIFASVSADFFLTTGDFFLAIRFNCLVNDEENEWAEVNAQRTDVYPSPWPVLWLQPLSQVGFDLDLRPKRAGDWATLPRILGQLLQLRVVES